MAKTLETIKILRAFVLMSKNKSEGVNYKEFVKEGIILEANYLIKKEYARKKSDSDDLYYTGPKDIYYHLTKKGKEHLNKLIKYSEELLT